MIRIIRTSVLGSQLLLLFFTGYSQTTQYSDFEPTVFEGSTIVKQVYSPALEGNLQGNPATQPLKVYLPPGYDNYSSNMYPVVYLLHGFTEDYNSFYLEYHLLSKLNTLISNKTVVPMIIVTPNADTKYLGSFYTNSYVSGNWEDYITKDVMQFIENDYRTLSQRMSRGLSGFSMGGHGTTIIAMKYPSLYSSVGLMSAALLDFEKTLVSEVPLRKENMIAAAGRPNYTSATMEERTCYAAAVAFAPDSTAKPTPGRLPYTADSVLIDSIWQEWLEHDPYTILPFYRDSLLKLNRIDIYIGNAEPLLPVNESFHLALQDYGIPHGYTIFQGGHNPSPVIDDVLISFSEQLIGVVPTVKSLSDYYLGRTDILTAVTDRDSKLYVVPSSDIYGIDSINKYQLATAEVQANNEHEFMLSDFDYGKYQVYAISQDSIVSNIPAEFVVVPDTSPPQLDVVSTNITSGDSIRVIMSRDGKICLVSSNPWFPDTLRSASEIITSMSLIKSTDALSGSEVSFVTSDLSPRTYLLYGFDQYGIVTGPVEVEVTPVGIPANIPPEISLYPNPTYMLLTIETNISDLYNIEITSLNGQLMHSRDFEGITHQLDLSSFQKGVYFITIRSKEFVITRKIVKL